MIVVMEVSGRASSDRKEEIPCALLFCWVIYARAWRVWNRCQKKSQRST
jgi:hypothetical protein